MPTILTIAKKEFKEPFFTPLAYVFMTVFLSLTFWIFFSDFFVRNEASMRLFFSWVPLLFMVFLPATTMGKWSDEKKSGTQEILLTLPITDLQIVLGKFLASVFFLLTTLAFTLPLVFTVASLGDLDWGTVIGGYVGLILLGSSWIAIGLYLSSITESAIIAFITSFIVLFFFYIIGESLVLNYVPQFLTPLFLGLSSSDHYQSIARGVLDSRDILYYASVTGFFIYLNLLSLENRKV